MFFPTVYIYKEFMLCEKMLANIYYYSLIWNSPILNICQKIWLYIILAWSTKIEMCPNTTSSRIANHLYYIYVCMHQILTWHVHFGEPYGLHHCTILESWGLQLSNEYWTTTISQKLADMSKNVKGYFFRLKLVSSEKKCPHIFTHVLQFLATRCSSILIGKLKPSQFQSSTVVVSKWVLNYKHYKHFKHSWLHQKQGQVAIIKSVRLKFGFNW